MIMSRMEGNNIYAAHHQLQEHTHTLKKNDLITTASGQAPNSLFFFDILVCLYSFFTRWLFRKTQGKGVRDMEGRIESEKAHGWINERAMAAN